VVQLHIVKVICLMWFGEQDGKSCKGSCVGLEVL
jgi:hypothetical protein